MGIAIDVEPHIFKLLYNDGDEQKELETTYVCLTGNFFIFLKDFCFILK